MNQLNLVHKNNNTEGDVTNGPQLAQNNLKMACVHYITYVRIRL